MRVLEKSSEKAKPGRPPILPDDLLTVAGPAGMGRRQKQNRYYALRAVSKLGERFDVAAGEVSWLVSEHRAKWTILSELGRLLPVDWAFWDAAGWILDEKPKTAEAVRVLRTFRTGKKPPAPGLVEELRRTIARHEEKYPGATDEHIIWALWEVLTEFEGEGTV